ncbi:hypothetical protein HPB52_000796 [Rhipicephalus sanguineus]|uniref:Uncharacterized protein n=1 Tax=Rhipicephalus sanguineus TaxID=34632 RepID=A0A9D4PT97_RHISA|nr:hypothetical protein HPB52_000796 [Rhipicephalus sanguineus]
MPPPFHTHGASGRGELRTSERRCTDVLSSAVVAARRRRRTRAAPPSLRKHALSEETRLWVLDQPGEKNLERTTELAEEYSIRRGEKKDRYRPAKKPYRENPKQPERNGVSSSAPGKVIEKDRHRDSTASGCAGKEKGEQDKNRDKAVEAKKPIVCFQCDEPGHSAMATMDVIHPSYVPADRFTGQCAWIRQVAQEDSVCLPVAKVLIKGPFGELETVAAVSQFAERCKRDREGTREFPKRGGTGPGQTMTNGDQENIRDNGENSSESSNEASEELNPLFVPPGMDRLLEISKVGPETIAAEQANLMKPYHQRSAVVQLVLNIPAEVETDFVFPRQASDSCAETSDSATEVHDDDADRDEDRLLDQDEEIAVAWADLRESYVPGDVHLSEFMQADSCSLVREERTDEDIIKSVQEGGVSSDDENRITQPDSALPQTSQVLDAFDIIRRCIG